MTKVWLAPPRRYTLGIAGAFWMCAEPDDFFAAWSLSETQHHCRTYPDDDRQCLRNEGDKVRDPGEPVQRPSPA